MKNFVYKRRNMYGLMHDQYYVDQYLISDEVIDGNSLEYFKATRFLFNGRAKL